MTECESGCWWNEPESSKWMVFLWVIPFLIPCLSNQQGKWCSSSIAPNVSMARAHAGNKWNIEKFNLFFTQLWKNVQLREKRGHRVIQRPDEYKLRVVARVSLRPVRKAECPKQIRPGLPSRSLCRILEIPDSATVDSLIASKTQYQHQHNKHRMGTDQSKS